MNDIVVCLFASFGYDKAAQGLTGEGRRLADLAGEALRVIIVGSGADALAAEVAAVADVALLADQPELADYQPELYLAALTELCRQRPARVVLLGSDTYSQEIAPRLAHRLGGSAVGDGSAVKLNGEAVRVTRQVYGGKAQAVVELKRAPAVAWLRSRSFAPATPRAASGEIRHVSVELTAGRSRIVEMVNTVNAIATSAKEITKITDVMYNILPVLPAPAGPAASQGSFSNNTRRNAGGPCRGVAPIRPSGQ